MEETTQTPAVAEKKCSNKNFCYCKAIMALLIIVFIWLWTPSWANIAITVLAILIILCSGTCCCKKKCSNC